MINSGKLLAFLQVCLVVFIIANAVDAAKTDTLGPFEPCTDFVKNYELPESDCVKCCKEINFESGKVVQDQFSGRSSCFCGTADAAKSEIVSESAEVAWHCPDLLKLRDESNSKSIFESHFESKYANNLGLLESDCDECCKQVNFQAGEVVQDQVSHFRSCRCISWLRGYGLRKERLSYIDQEKEYDFSDHYLSNSCDPLGFFAWQNRLEYRNDPTGRPKVCRACCGENIAFFYNGFCNCLGSPTDYADGVQDFHCRYLSGFRSPDESMNPSPLDGPCNQCCKGLNYESGKMIGSVDKIEYMYASDEWFTQNCFCRPWSRKDKPSANELAHVDPGVELDFDNKVSQYCDHIIFDIDQEWLMHSDEREEQYENDGFSECNDCCEPHIGIIYNGKCKCFPKTN